MTVTPGGQAPRADVSAAAPSLQATPPTDPSPPGERWKLAASWLVVGIPAAWGVAQVVLKSLALFR